MPRPTAPSVTAAEKDARALELRRAGLSYRQVAAQMGVSVGAAWKYVTRGLDRTRREPADQLRRLEEDRLDLLQVQAAAVLRRTHYYVQGGEVVMRDGEPLRDDGPTLNAIRVLLAVQERRARLLGLDEPTRIDAKVSLRVAWERATHEERMGLVDVAIAELSAELDRTDPPTPPAVETIPPPAGDPDPEAIATAVEAALDAAGVPPDRREAAYQAVEQQLQERAR